MTTKLPVIPSIRSFRDVESALNNFRSYLVKVGELIDTATAEATYSPIAKGVSGGNLHDHSGGDGATISHTSLSSIGTNTHDQIDTAITASSGHIAAASPHSGHELISSKNAVSGYAGLNAASRVTKGVDATDDMIVNNSAKGFVGLDTQATPHYWRITPNGTGGLTVTDLGTSKP